MEIRKRTENKPSNPITIFMCGDVMTGRGIDQVLPQPVDFSYIWGDALEEFERVVPDLEDY